MTPSNEARLRGPVVTAPRQRPAGGTLNQAIANAVVRRQSRIAGRGPSRAQAFHHDDVIVVVVRDTLTQSERSLLAGGMEDAVRRLRADIQEAIREPLVRDVEALTGGKVIAFMSATHLDPDLAVELFVLERPVVSGAAAPVA
jgi:uncharacterized protein YbcI